MATKGDTTNSQNGTKTITSLHPSSGTPKLPNRTSATANTSRERGDPIILPPGTSSSRFQTFISRAKKIVGDKNVEIILPEDPSQDGDYMHPCHAHDMHAILDRDYFVASAVLYPKDVPDVQAIMKLCNEVEVPVWPYSIGRHTGYGGAAPRVPGSVAMNLGRHMNKVLKVDADDAWALVEPGVTFFDLHEYLERNGLREKVWLDVPDLGGGSIIGNTAERGVRYTPYGDHWMMHCGLEVILPSGELIRTGMGALPDPTIDSDPSIPPHDRPGNRAWHLFNYGFGPYNDGIFSQSSLGIIVKMGIWLMPNPGGYQAYMITLPRDKDLHAAMEIIRPLRIQMVLQNVPTLRHILLDAAVANPKSHYTDKKGALDDDELDKIAKDHDLGR